ncbi:hypothetical protein BC936DRAFT_144709 [Jimgerdemannia flammicorona]|uniref:Afadin and alpha-actinin-binding-domain-containing protein n=1 Tax=Jimgerdemannia flammicorona TaxID=994334 RepID=A0A433DBU7_9FUNG|nr:hypothetical protein BC936DRAFT_144709 [Jimgerdemannia flammicorona]
MDERDDLSGLFNIPVSSEHFCTPGNIASAADYINHQLASQGYPELRFLNNDVNDVSKIINCISTLLQQRQNDVEKKPEELDTLTTNMTKVKSRLEQSEREKDMLKAKLTTSEENIQYIKTQYAHELRKREQDNGKLKERMQKILNDKYKGSNISLTLINPAPKSSTLPTKSGISQVHSPYHSCISEDIRKRSCNADEEMYHEVLQGYEEREREILAENQSLRQSLTNLYREIDILLRGQVATFSAPFPSESGNNLGSLPYAPIPAEVARFQMPFNMTGEHIEEDLKGLLDMLKKEWNSRPAMVSVEEMQGREQEIMEKDEEIDKQRKEIEDLLAQLDEKKFVSEEQDKVIDHFLSGNFFQGASEEVQLNMSGATNHRRPAVRKVWSKNERDDVIMEDATPISLLLSTRQTPNTTSATSGYSQYLRPALRAAVTSRNGKREVTIADDDMLQSPSVKHPRLDSTDENNIERRESIARRDKALAQTRVTRRGSVTSTSMKENLSNGPSSSAEQRFAKAKIQQLQTANAKFRATGAVSPSPASTSSRSLAAIASKAAASVVNSPRRPPARVARLVSQAAHLHNTNTAMSHTSSNSSSEDDVSSGSANFVKRSTSAKRTTSMEKAAAQAQAEAARNRSLRLITARAAIAAMTRNRKA